MLSKMLFSNFRWQLERNLENVPDSATTSLHVAQEMQLENISTVLEIICVLAVTSNAAERSFSRLKLLKTVLRSTMANER